MTTGQPAQDDDDRPLFADGVGDTERPFSAPVIRRRTVIGTPEPVAKPPTRLVGPLTTPSAAGPDVASSRSAKPVPDPVASRGVLVGRINGQITTTKQARLFYGLPTLLGVLIAIAAAALLYATGGALLAILLALAVLMVLTSVIAGGIAALFQIILRGFARLLFSLLALVTGGANKAARGTVRAATIRQEITVQRFQVHLLSGEYITCLMYGELSADDLHKDDHIGINARERKGHYVAKSIDVLTPGGQRARRVRARLPLRFLLMRWVDWSSFVLTALIVAVGIAQLF